MIDINDYDNEDYDIVPESLKELTVGISQALEDIQKLRESLIRALQLWSSVSEEVK